MHRFAKARSPEYTISLAAQAWRANTLHLAESKEPQIVSMSVEITEKMDDGRIRTSDLLIESKITHSKTVSRFRQDSEGQHSIV